VKVNQAATAVINANLETAMDLAERCWEAYRRATPQQRHEINQAMFERILVHEEGVLEAALA